MLKYFVSNHKHFCYFILIYFIVLPNFFFFFFSFCIGFYFTRWKVVHLSFKKYRWAIIWGKCIMLILLCSVLLLLVLCSNMLDINLTLKKLWEMHVLILWMWYLYSLSYHSTLFLQCFLELNGIGKSISWCNFCDEKYVVIAVSVENVLKLVKVSLTDERVEKASVVKEYKKHDNEIRVVAWAPNTARFTFLFCFVFTLFIYLFIYFCVCFLLLLCFFNVILTFLNCDD